ncbi:hypothetical protein I862_02315 [endosymbiont of Acanthamoeba sp. UWC8]|uniref:hypothetical protein n=1 Tax=endosymbiont of Acanthamoeba sp. UWC8 TaxID=86106 RepID=UPI0004D0C4AC|nr:hypothetical protein [endosymbiont of Acanthamoeba sp. UWC8]AIF81026.1 hypothetical protein I862_02315 [endosymbiont of Acanthamoeba sp. UWC8]
MIFWNDIKLALQLRNSEIDEDEKFYYYLVTVVLFTICGLKGGLLALSVEIIGLFCIFKANRRGDNKAFIERVVCLSLPIAVKGFVLLLLIISIEMLMLEFIINSKSGLNSFILINSLFYLFYYYIRLYKSIKVACGLTDR